MVIVGKSPSLATFTSAAGVAVAPSALVEWSAGNSIARFASLAPGGTGIAISRAGTYRVTVKFATPPASRTMNFGVTRNGVDYGQAALTGETLLAILYLAAGDVVGVRNTSLGSVTPDPAPNAAWLSIEGC